MATAAIASNAAVTTALVAAEFQALKASGILVRLGPEEFQSLLNRTEAPLIVRHTSGYFRKTVHCLVHYRGFVFYTQSRQPIELPANAEIIDAKSLWLPS